MNVRLAVGRGIQTYIWQGVEAFKQYTFGRGHNTSETQFLQYNLTVKYCQISSTIIAL